MKKNVIIEFEEISNQELKAIYGGLRIPIGHPIRFLWSLGYEFGQWLADSTCTHESHNN